MLQRTRGGWGEEENLSVQGESDRAHVDALQVARAGEIRGRSRRYLYAYCQES